MSLALKYLPASRGTLVLLRRKLSLTERGKEILEMRREQLVKAIVDLINVVKRRPSVEHKLVRVLEEIARVRLARGEVEYSSLASLVSEPELDVLAVSYHGVPVPQIRVRSPPGAELLHDSELRRLSAELWEAVAELVEVVNAELALERLAAHLNYINRVVNGLERIIIPQLRETIRRLEERVEEEALEEFTRLKRVRGRHP